MSKNEAQREADELLETAVKKVVQAYQLIPDGSLLTDFIVTGEGTHYTDDGDETCDIFLAFRNGHVRLTSALGILELARRQLIEGCSCDLSDE